MSSFTVSSRAALAGNPSDGFEGAVVSIPIPTMAATVAVGEGPRSGRLVAATIERFSHDVVPIDETVTLDVATTIPRSVGLAGSSAIVIAGLRALAAHVGETPTDAELSLLAHTIERRDLGIAGGWQDQICQVAGAPVAMEFSGAPSARLIRPGRTIPFWVAWDEQAAEPSGESHGELRRAMGPDTPAMSALADLARAAATAFEAGDVHALKASMDATLDLRFELMPIHPRHQAMAESARALGAACNFTGSGGAIIGVLPKDTAPFLDGLAASGLHTTTWEVHA